MSSLAYSCVLFDLDGTLADTLTDIACAMNHALVKHGYPPLDTEAYRPLVGNGLRRLASDALPRDAASDSRAALIAGEAQQYYTDHPADYASPYPGIIHLLGELKRLNVKTAVLSNKPDTVTQLVIAKLFPAGLFDCAAGERPGVARKPDPASAWEALAAMDRTPRQTMLAGDSEVDMETARNIGCLPVGVSWGFRPAQALRKAGAALIVDHPKEILSTTWGGRRPFPWSERE